MEDPEVVVRGTRHRPGSGREEPSLAVTEVDPEELLLVGRGIGDALATTPSVRYKTTGGDLHMGWLLVRGASPVQVAHFLDGLPLAAGFGGALDLATLPVAGFASIQLFRGTMPAEFGMHGIGGALNLVPTLPRQRWMQLHDTRGSFETWKLSAATGTCKPFRAMLAGSVGTTSGNYPYFSDGGTIYTKIDDAIRPRENNQVMQIQLLGRIMGKTPFGRLVTTALVSDRTAGVPGPHSIVTSQSVHHQRRLRLQSTLRQKTGKTDLYIEHIRDHYRDPLGELGVGITDNLNEFWLGGLWQGFGFRRKRWHGNLFGHLSGERWEPVHVTTGTPDIHTRLTSLVTGQVNFLGEKWKLQAVGHQGWVHTRDKDRMPTGFHLGFLFKPCPEWEVKANLSRALREPSFAELYGDFGATRGNPDLLPEKSLQADAGLVYKKRWGLFSLQAETGVFARKVKNLIQFIPNSQFVSVPQNIGQADFFGVENRMTFRWHHTRLTGSVTFLDTENLSGSPEVRGNPLPGRPRWTTAAELSQRFSRAGHLLEGALGLLREQQSNFDTAARRPMPDRLQLDARLLWTLPGGQVTFSLDARNLLNRIQEDVQRLPEPASGPLFHPQAVSDQLGYPIPGRSLFFTLSIKP